MTRRILIGASIFFILPCLVNAQESSLGNFPVDKVKEVIDQPIFFHLEDKKFAVDKDSFLRWMKIRPSLEFKEGYNSEIENIDYFPTSDASLRIYFRFITRQEERYRTKISTNLAIDEKALRDYLENAKAETRVEPVNARLGFSEGKVNAFSLSREGYEIDTKKSFEKIVQAFSKNPHTKDVALEATVLEPEVSSAQIDKYGIKELIGTGESNFRGSPRNRVHNIKVGASKFNGILIKPGEEFSFITTLGPVDKSTGYLPELVIKKDKTIPEYGGGMCQVSTTMFRSALNSGLKITARTNHAYPVQYYAPHGLDATVYIPRPDLKFLNDTPAHILIQSRIESTRLFFDFYGTSDERKVEIVGPFVTSRGEGGAMKTVAYQEVYSANGDLARKDTFKSNYDSPSKYPHPGDEEKIITEKPDDWSSREWKEYKKSHGL